MNRALEVALIGVLTSVSVLAIAAVFSAGLRILHSVGQGLTRHYPGQVTGGIPTSRLLMGAWEAMRRGMLAFGSGLFAAGVYAARNFTLIPRTLEVSEREQVGDRYAKGVEQLGSGLLDVRIGGIYALERVAHDSPQDHPAVMDVLVAFVRGRSRVPSPPVADDNQPRQPKRVISHDAQAAIIVIGRRRFHHDSQLVNLDHTNLIRANLTRANLAYANLAYADLTGADLAGADLTGADLTSADLTGAILKGANLTGAILRGADLTRANLTHANLASKGFFGDAALFGADLTYANLTGTILKRADFTDAILPRADLTDADLTGAVFRGADLTHANLTRADLTREDLTGAGLFRANLPGANFTGANLTGAVFRGAKFTGANFTGAGLFGADLADADLADVHLARAHLTDADLLGARWPRDAAIPAGWQRDAGSGRLRRTGTDSCEVAT